MSLPCPSVACNRPSNQAVSIPSAVIGSTRAQWQELVIRLLCNAQLPVFTLQRDDRYFGRPMEFIPERWVEGCPEEQSLNRHVPGSWMAFGEGTRVCVGQRFALVEAKITLAKLFRK